MEHLDILSHIMRCVERNAQNDAALSDDIWDHPQTDFAVDYAAGRIRSRLAQNGFRITDNLDGIPNCLRAEYGKGKPVIAFLGEYDALGALSQKANCTVREPVTPGAPGHGCGHNLLGVGALSAAIAVKELLCDGSLSGTVVYFGCPAEETASAKAFLARDGCFAGLDAILCWHPWDYTGIWPGGSLANVKLIFRFSGRSAHAAGSPHLGRSALDALELMNVGVQFLREHIPDGARIHYAITDAGGTAPNVVQARAEAVYLVRAGQAAELEDIKTRVIDCARGAALMTGTRVDVEFVKGCSNMLPNTALEDLLIDCMETIGVPRHGEDELALARALHNALEAPERTLERISRLCAPAERAKVLAHRGEAMYDFIAPHCPTDEPIVPVSTDVGDASWQAPTGQISVAAWPADTPAHSWQAVAVGKSAIAHRATEFAAKTLAFAAARLMSEQALLERARAEFAERIAAQPYICPIPPQVMPKIG